MEIKGFWQRLEVKGGYKLLWSQQEHSVLLKGTLMEVDVNSFGSPTQVLIANLADSDSMTFRSPESFSNLQATPALEYLCNEKGMR